MPGNQQSSNSKQDVIDKWIEKGVSEQVALQLIAKNINPDTDFETKYLNELNLALADLPNLAIDSKTRIEQAYRFSYKQHLYNPKEAGFAVRKGGKPSKNDESVPDEGLLYISHPVAVAAEIISQYPNHEHIVDLTVAALLHDVLEDTNFDAGQYEQFLGIVQSETSLSYKLVDGATKIDGNKAATFEKISEFTSQYSSLAILKGADRWHNMLTVAELGEQKGRVMCNENKLFFIPLLEQYNVPFFADEIERMGNEYLESLEPIREVKFESSVPLYEVKFQ